MYSPYGAVNTPTTGRCSAGFGTMATSSPVPLPFWLRTYAWWRAVSGLRTGPGVESPSASESPNATTSPALPHVSAASATVPLWCFFMDRYRIAPGAGVDLSAFDPDDRSLFPAGKDAGRERLKELRVELRELQELLYAEGKHKVLVVLQAMDAGGKDGTIRHVFRGVNPAGVRVASFKVPTAEELDHDFLWRVHEEAPATGEITIFNRSHYEDVLVVRVKDIVPEDVWRSRYEHIRNFEKLLADAGTTVLKFYLHISKDEQKERLEARRDRPDKRWKFNVGDLEERKRWDDYMAAFEEAIAETSTPWAPWYVVPANRKWYRNLVIVSTLIEALRGLDMAYPEPEEDVTQYEVV